MSGLDCVFDNLMNGTAMITSKWGWKWDDIIYDLGMRLSDIAPRTEQSEVRNPYERIGESVRSPRGIRVGVGLER